MSFLLAAYAALWLGVFAYVLRLAARLRELGEEARRLAEASARSDRGARHPLEPATPASGATVPPPSRTDLA